MAAPAHRAPSSSFRFSSPSLINPLISAAGSYAFARYSGEGVPPLAAAVAAIAIPTITNVAAELYGYDSNTTQLFDACQRFTVLTLLIKWSAGVSLTAASKQAGKHLLLALGIQQLLGALIRRGTDLSYGRNVTIV